MSAMYRDDLYRDPGLYDLEYQGQADDVAWYRKLAARHRGPILELGCGNGRITLPLARDGHTVHGVDLSREMLASGHDKLAREPDEVRQRVRLERRSFYQLEGLGTFPLVLLPFNALHHVSHHRELLHLFAQVREHLAPGGVFALDCYLPDPVLYARDPEQRYEERVFVDPRTGGPLHTWERGWYDPQTQTNHVVYIYRPASGVEYEVQLDLRMYYPQELRALIELGDLRIVHEAEDFAGTPLGPQSLKWVMVLEDGA